MQLLLLVHKCYYHNHLLPEIYYDYFQPNQGVLVVKLGTKLSFIYIALIQLLDRDVLSLNALCYGMTSLTTLKYPFY